MKRPDYSFGEICTYMTHLAGEELRSLESIIVSYRETPLGDEGRRSFEEWLDKREAEMKGYKDTYIDLCVNRNRFYQCLDEDIYDMEKDRITKRKLAQLEFGGKVSQKIREIISTLPDDSEEKARLEALALEGDYATGRKKNPDEKKYK